MLLVGLVIPMRTQFGDHSVRRAHRRWQRASHSAQQSLSLDQGRFALRICVVNFRTTEEVMADIPELVAEAGQQVDARLRRL